jgi:hypothetical protein
VPRIRPDLLDRPRRPARAERSGTIPRWLTARTRSTAQAR